MARPAPDRPSAAAPASARSSGRPATAGGSYGRSATTASSSRSTVMADAGPCASTRSWTHRTRRPVLRSTAGSRDAMGPTPSTALRLLSGLFGGDRVSRLTHSLQSATRARRDGATVDWVVAALVQDIGDLLAPENHRELAAAVLQPHVPDEVFWLVLHHGLYQRHDCAHHLGGDRDGAGPLRRPSELRALRGVLPPMGSAIVRPRRSDRSARGLRGRPADGVRPAWDSEIVGPGGR